MRYCDFCGVREPDEYCSYTVYATNARIFAYPGFYCCDQCRVLLDDKSSTEAKALAKRLVGCAEQRVGAEGK